MPLGAAFGAPVHLPQGAVVKSIALETCDESANPATSSAYFGRNSTLRSLCGVRITYKLP